METIDNSFIKTNLRIMNLWHRTYLNKKKAADIGSFLKFLIVGY